MAIAFRTSSAAGASSSSLVTSQALTIPSAIQAGDVMLVVVHALTELSTQSTLSIASTGTTLHLLPGTTPLWATHGGFSVNAAAYYAVATGADAGATITASSGDSAFWGLGIVAYSGCSPSAPIDVSPAGNVTTTTTSIATPSASTVTAGDWAVYLLSLTTESGAPTDPAGTTSRLAYLGGTDVGAYIADSNGSVGGSGTAIGGGSFTAPGNGTWWATFTVGLKAAGTFEPFYVSTDGNGVQTWSVPYTGNQPYTFPTSSSTGSGIRVLPPSSPAAGFAHGFVYTLPVSNGFDDTTFGNGLDTIRGLGAQNSYNLTVVEPSFGISPWYADNPSDLTQQLETFMTLLRGWAQVQFGTGAEKHYLLGFSKSGLGGSGLLFKHPSLWYAGGFWDFPGQMTDYDGTDPNGTVGGSPAFNYGTSANFQANYRLSTGNITTWNTAAGGEFTSSRRLWIGGYFSFQADVSGYRAELTGLGVLYDGSWTTLDSSHAWHAGWVAAALLSIVHPAASGLLMASGII